jgi:hypothetical protein
MLEADQSALARRIPDRSAAVARVGEGDEPGGRGGGRTATRSTRGVVRIPQIARRPVGVGLGNRPRAEFGHVGAPDDDEPGCEKALHDVRRRLRAVVHALQEARSAVDRISGAADRAQVLQEEGDAAKRPVRKVAGSFVARAIEVLVDDGVELWIQALDPRDRSLDQFDRLQVAPAHQQGLLRRVRLGPCITHSGLLPFQCGFADGDAPD